MPSEGKRCETCRYYNAREGVQRGECRKSPPVLHQDSGSFCWPGTYKEEWCGEHLMARVASVAQGAGKLRRTD